MHGLIMIALGGAIGSLLRYFIVELTLKLTGTVFPWGTIAVNLIGCFIIGIVWGIVDKFGINPNLKMFIFIGLLGSFTTFSTFALENFYFLKNGEISFLALNIAVSNIIGILLVFIGFYTTNLILLNR